MELFKIENAFDLRRDIEDAIERIGPEFNNEGTFTKFAGWASKKKLTLNFSLFNVRNGNSSNKIYAALYSASISGRTSAFKSPRRGRVFRR